MSPAVPTREDDPTRRNGAPRVAGPIVVVVAGVALLIAVFLPWVDDYDGTRTGWRIYELQNERVIDSSVFSAEHYHDCFCTVYTGLTFVVVGGFFTIGGAALAVAMVQRIMRRAARVLAGVLAVLALIAATLALTNISTFTTPGTTPQYGAWLVLVACVLAIGGAARSWWVLRRAGGPSQPPLDTARPTA
jgi:quinol-cytochrome oxidoreductase complex cytochrome b subunit